MPSIEAVKEQFGLLNDAEAEVTIRRSDERGIPLAVAAASVRSERVAPYNHEDYTLPTVADDGESRPPEDAEPEPTSLDEGEFAATVAASSPDKGKSKEAK